MAKAGDFKFQTIDTLLISVLLLVVIVASVTAASVFLSRPGR